MPRPSAPARFSALLLGAALSSLLAACASGPDGGSRPAPGGTRKSPAAARSDAEAPPADALNLPATGVKAGWLDPRPGGKSRLVSLTLLSASSQEGKLIATGRARMDGGKVISDRDASDLLQAYKEAGFDRFAVKAKPEDAPASTLGVIWIDRGQGTESLFFLPGSRQNPQTRDLPDVYDGLKKLILYVHQTSPGSMVIAGEGWSGDEMINQKVEKPKR